MTKCCHVVTINSSFHLSLSILVLQQCEGASHVSGGKSVLSVSWLQVERFRYLMGVPLKEGNCDTVKTGHVGVGERGSMKEV